jgi:hypothetical protein
MTSQTLTERVEALEKRNVAYDILLEALNRNDTSTSHALEALTAAVKDPETGLIVQFNQFRSEIREQRRADRRVILAFLGGLVILVNLVQPYVPQLVHALVTGHG